MLAIISLQKQVLTYVLPASALQRKRVEQQERLADKAKIMWKYESLEETLNDEHLDKLRLKSNIKMKVS